MAAANTLSETSETSEVYEYVQLRNPSVSKECWDGYVKNLSKMSIDAMQYLRCSVDTISELIENAQSGTDTIISGLVIGSVQSGKTANLLGLLAQKIDSGSCIIVVLSGTKKNLWQQTVTRAHENLPSLTKKYTMLPDKPHIDASRTSERYVLEYNYIDRIIKDNMSMVYLILKHPDHIRELRNALEPVYESIEKQKKQYTLLIIDDEADEASIIDSTNGIPAVTPTHIADLWNVRKTGVTIPAVGVQPVVIGYTATPQANLLQLSTNPLAPVDFIYVLRTPGLKNSSTSQIPREASLEYTETNGWPSIYTGGRIFYNSEISSDLCVIDNDADSILRRSFRAFCVSAAFGLNDSKTASMLVHTSASQKDHFDLADTFFSKVLAGIDSVNRQGFIPVEALKEDLDKNDERWKYWFESYMKTRDIIRQGSAIDLPVLLWENVKNVIKNSVFPNLSIRVINSNPAADEMPSTHEDEMSEFTIFISGNMMSRGLTVKNLLTSVFLREPAQKVVDTRIQMQRWFGYRGAYIYRCRLFASASQMESLKSHYRHDIDLKIQIEDTDMNSRGRLDLRPLVPYSSCDIPTKKIRSISMLEANPGPFPFIRNTNSPNAPDPNCKILSGLFHDSKIVEVDSIVRGMRIDGKRSSLAIAEILDSLSYSTQPFVPVWRVKSWQRLSETGDSKSFYNPRVGFETITSKHITWDCDPYQIAAYLRLWASKQKEPNVTTPPYFNIGLRFGNGEPTLLDGLDFYIKPVERKGADNGLLTSTWGSRNIKDTKSSFKGDQWFDGSFSENVPSGDEYARPIGSDGLLLFYVLETNPYKTVTVGLAIPEGGPQTSFAVNPIEGADNGKV